METAKGEICFNFINADGTRNGFDKEMLNYVCGKVNIPVIASGGVGEKKLPLTKGIHLYRSKLFKQEDIKNMMKQICFI